MNETYATFKLLPVTRKKDITLKPRSNFLEITLDKPSV